LPIIPRAKRISNKQKSFFENFGSLKKPITKISHSLLQFYEMPVIMQLPIVFLLGLSLELLAIRNTLGKPKKEEFA